MIGVDWGDGVIKLVKLTLVVGVVSECRVFNVVRMVHSDEYKPHASCSTQSGC